MLVVFMAIISTLEYMYVELERGTDSKMEHNMRSGAFLGVCACVI